MSFTLYFNFCCVSLIFNSSFFVTKCKSTKLLFNFHYLCGLTIQVEHISTAGEGIIKLLRYPERDVSGADLSIFTPDERKQYDSFKSVKRCAEFYYVRVLWKAFEIDLPIRYDTLGRPYLDKGFISISHSHDLILIAYDASHPVGIDVEYYSPKIREIQHKFISTADEKLIDLSSDRDLTITWSIKEAVYKMERIEGLSFREHIHVAIEGDEARVEVVKGAERHRYNFRYLDRFDYIITFCSHAYLD